MIENIEMQGELVSSELKIPISRLGIVQLVGEGNVKFIRQHICRPLEALKSAILFHYRFGASIVIPERQIHGVKVVVQTFIFFILGIFPPSRIFSAPILFLLAGQPYFGAQDMK